MKNTNLMLKFSLDHLEFRNSTIYEIAGIWARVVLNTFLLCKNKKGWAQLNIFAGFSCFFPAFGRVLAHLKPHKKSYKAMIKA